MSTSNTRAVQGKNCSIYVDGQNCSEFLNEFKFESKRDDDDVTPFESDDKVVITSAAENSLTLTGFWNGDEDSLDELLDATFGTDDDNVVTVLPGGMANVGKGCYLATGTQVTYDVSAKADEKVEGEAEFKTARVRGRVLKGPQAVTTTGTGTPLTSPAETDRGLTANLHVLSMTGVTSATIVVQGSPDGDTWADLVTFTVTKKGGYTAKTLKNDIIPEKLQCKWTPTGTGSINFALAAGRRA